MRLYCLLTQISCVALLLVGHVPLAASEPLDGYLNYQAFHTRVQTLGEHEGVRVTSLGKSRQDRDLWAIELGAATEAKQDKKSKKKEATQFPVNKPAWVIVGSIQPDHPLGSELALRMAEQLADQWGKDKTVDQLLSHCTLYIIPRPDPDGLEKCFAPLHRTPGGNARKTDDDRDFSVGEDPDNDLNGDGWITQIRVADEAGSWRSHPEDPRVLIEVDSKQKELGGFRLFSEGTDDDHDEAFNEDNADGVNLNRNFTFHYAPFQPHTGPNAVSEPESRALADFFFDHPQIAGVLTFSNEDNLFHPWKHDSGKDKGEIRNTIAPQDATVLTRLGEEYRKLHGGKDCPASPAGKGSFSEWAYFHFGRWSLVSRAWWVPTVAKEEPKKEADAKAEAEPKEGTKEESKAAAEPATETKPDEDKKEDKKTDETKPESSPEKRGTDDLNALRWLKREKIDGFVDWQPIDHPDFTGKQVEVGGFKPFALSQPPASELDGLAAKQVTFLGQLVEQLPQLALVDTKVEALGGQTFRITTHVINRGQLPTMPEMGAITDQVYPLQISLNLPEKTEWLSGHPRSKVDRLKGQGGQAKLTWLVRLPEDLPQSIQIRVWSPSVGEAQISVDIPR